MSQNVHILIFKNVITKKLLGLMANEQLLFHLNSTE